MSGDVQPRKRKDKKRKRDDEPREQHQGVHGSKMGSDDVHLHVQGDHETGGHWCAKIFFFSLLAVLLGLVGLIILENRGLSDLDTPLSESRFSNYFDGWVDEHREAHEEHDAVSASIEEHEHGDEPFEEEEDHSEVDEAEDDDDDDEKEPEEEDDDNDDNDEDTKENEEEEEDEDVTEEVEAKTVEEDDETQEEENQTEEDDENDDETVEEPVEETKEEEDDDDVADSEDNNTQDTENKEDDNDDDDDDDDETAEVEEPIYKRTQRSAQQATSTQTSTKEEEDDDDEPFEEEDDDGTFESLESVVVDNDAQELLLLQEKARQQQAASKKEEPQPEEETPSYTSSLAVKIGVGVALALVARLVLIRKNPNTSEAPTEALMKRRLTIASPEDTFAEDADELLEYDYTEDAIINRDHDVEDEEEYIEEEIEEEEEIEVTDDEYEEKTEKPKYVPETFEQFNSMYRPKQFEPSKLDEGIAKKESPPKTSTAIEPKLTKSLESSKHSEPVSAVKPSQLRFNQYNREKTPPPAEPSRSPQPPSAPPPQAKNIREYTDDPEEEIEYDDEEYDDEMLDEEEEDDIADDEGDEDDVSDVDDSELMNRLEAKYGRLPAKEYESDEDVDDPSWTKIKSRGGGPQAMDDDAFEEELRRANEEMLREFGYQ